MLSNAAAPVTWQAMSMSDSNGLYAGSGLAKNKRVRKPAKQNAARSMFERWKPLRLFGNLPNWHNLFHQGRLPPLAGCVAQTNRRQRAFPEEHRDGCGVILASRGQLSPKTTPCVFPRDHLNRATVDLLETHVNLTAPSFFRTLIYLGIETFEQIVYQCGACFHRKRKCVF
jgi:hypothetical protein